MVSNNASKFIVASGTIILLIAVYALTLNSIYDQDVFDGISGSGSVSNETILDVSNITARTVTKAPLEDFSMTVVEILNSTDGVLIAPGNYTATTGGTIIATDAGALSSFNGTDWYVTYTYTYTTNSTQSGINVTELKASFGSFAVALLGFLTIIGTIVAVVWMIRYVRELFSKKAGIGGMTA